MCGNCKEGSCKKMCVCGLIAKILVIVGALNWGLVGIGMFIGYELNLVKLIFGSMPTVEAIVYILVGVAAIMKIFGCMCHKCKEACVNGSCAVDGKMEEKM